MGKRTAFLAACAAGLFAGSQPAEAQVTRQDAIWARAYSGTITLDGNLNEAGWSSAETKVIHWVQDSGMPGSGWKAEGGLFPSDPSVATLKFLVKGNQLYLGAVVQDKSIGGSASFNRFDGFLMALKDHSNPLNAPKPPAEYFYAWWYANSTDPQPPGQQPAFIGRWATWPPGTPRTPAQIAAWDARTVVGGISNTDAVDDASYTVEMRFDLTPMGYNVAQAGGDILEWNISVYDCDWFWPLNAQRFSSNRTWWQGPWGNAAVYNEVRIYARPDVTTGSGAVPFINPSFVCPVIAGTPPTINGSLSEAVWNNAAIYDFDIRWDDAPLRQTYPEVGPHRAGQYQPPVNGGTAQVLDPADATVKMFVNGNRLYMGFDVRDQVVQYHASFDRWDGFLLSINERGVLGNDNELLGRRLSFQVAQNGTALPQDYLSTLVANGQAQVAISLNPGTVVDTMGTSADNGYQAELSIDLTALGYPTNLGDRILFLGLNHLDGDSFTPYTDSYGTRTWWFREYENTCCPPWIHIEGSTSSAPEDVAESMGVPYGSVSTNGNPSASPVIQYELPEANAVRLQLFDVQGRLVNDRELGVVATGKHEITIDDASVGAGIYFYRLEFSAPGSGTVRSTPFGKLIIVR